MAVIENYKDDILYFTIDGFNNKGMTHLFSSRIGWDQKNIFKGVSRIFNIDDKNIFRATQVHGDDILVIDNNSGEEVKEKEVDGLITKLRGVALSTYHADCTPMYFYDDKKKVIGMAHGGWRGTYKNIAGKMVKKMLDEFSSNPENIKVGLGPSICKNCYEIKEDLVKLFKENYKEEDIIINKDGKIYLDLWKINEINLIKAGILKENIKMSNYCTSCNTDKLYSYRKENKTKNRMVASIMLEKIK